MNIFSVGYAPKGTYPEDQTWHGIWADSKDEAIRLFEVECKYEGGDSLTQKEIDEVLYIEEFDAVELCDETLIPKECGVERRMKVLRKIGFHYEDEHQCEQCDEWNAGEMCDGCNCCEECCECEEDD